MSFRLSEFRSSNCTSCSALTLVIMILSQGASLGLCSIHTECIKEWAKTSFATHLLVRAVQGEITEFFDPAPALGAGGKTQKSLPPRTVVLTARTVCLSLRIWTLSIRSMLMGALKLSSYKIGNDPLDLLLHTSPNRRT